SGANEAAKETALRRATQYVDSRFRYRGEKVSEDQALEWPRIGFAWPMRRVIDATCEAAVRTIDKPLYVDVGPEDVIIQETIGPLSTRYADPAGDLGQTFFAVVDALLTPLKSGSSGMVRVVRA